MTISTEPFQTILEDARRGELQLPEFQRDYIWKRREVVDLFDSLRQRFPIGALLFMERNPDIGIVPRPFEGTAEILETTVPSAFVLDGQQRITSGLAIYYGLGASQYYLDLQQLWKLAGEQTVDFSKAVSVQAFLDDLEPDDGYCVGRMRRSDPLALIERHLLYTGVLHDTFATRDLLRRYTDKFPDRTAFIDGVIRDSFRLGADVHVPVTRVEKNRPVEAVSRIFATLNTTGQPLNSFELVVAILYPAGIRLRTDIQENRELFPHYANMDRTGEVFLQTIAMLDGKPPKKSQLPKTIKPEAYLKYRNDSVDLLERLGVFLTERLGVGLDQTNSLIPYDSIFAPMALVLKRLNELGLKSADKTIAERKLQKWFVASALANRYQEGVHNKQDRDRREVEAWIESEGDSMQPSWITELKIPRLTSDGPDGAIGRLMRCLINLRKPIDPVTEHAVGYRPGAVVSAKHHIWPTRWCDKYMKGGWSKADTSDLALNITMVSQETNIRWVNADPANQLQEIRTAHTSELTMAQTLTAHFLDKTCVEIMRRPDKTKDDFQSFLVARERLFLDAFEHWGLSVVGEEPLPNEE
jgi:hypothetical protein